MADDQSIEPDDMEIDPEEVEEELQPLGRDDELSTRKSVETQLLDLYDDVEKGFQDQYQRSNDNMDYWDVYNCMLGG